MARIRTIKPEFWKHEGLCELPEATHMLAAALLNYADDYGYFNANPKLIHGEIYPLREPSVSVPESLWSLQSVGYVRLGTGEDGRRYGQIIEFEKHQRVSHPTDSKISILSIAWEASGKSHEALQNSPETFVPEQGTGKGMEQGTGKGELSAVADPPRRRAAKAIIPEPEGFQEFYQAYPKKVDRPDAMKAYREALKRASAAVILAAAKRYAAEKIGEDKKFLKLPGGWLRSDRWLDEASGTAPVAGIPANLAEIQRLEEEATRTVEEAHVH